MKKILIINTIGLGYEGISNVIYNYGFHMNKEGLELNILAPLNVRDSVEERFSQIGKVIKISRRNSDLKRYVCALSKLLKANRYDVIHIHGNSGTMLIEVLLAKMTSVKKIIVHCHNTTCSHLILNQLLKVPMILLSDCLMACSEDAGKFLYGKKDFVVLNNAIDIKKFSYNEQVRTLIRKELGIKDELTIGHIGNFIEQKNHSFLIDVFDELHKMKPNSKLLLVSDGPLIDLIRVKVENLQLENDVIFAGRRTDIEKLYQAMDIFVLPSLWEGLPLVSLEAQSEGLLVLTSVNVTSNARCTDLFEQLELEKGAKVWAEKIEEMICKAIDRNKDRKEQMREYGFDIEYECEKLRKIYMNNACR